MDSEIQDMKSEPQIISQGGRGRSYEYVGSALILTVVLTSLLAIVGVLFVMVSRVDRMATSSLSEYKELNFAIDSVIERISQELASDVPGVPGQEYYDYPDIQNIWLASLEPVLVDSNGTPDPSDDIYIWRQISDITGYFAQRGSNQNIQIKVNINDILFNAIVEDHKPIIAPNGNLVEQLADADGDGIADSKWIELENTNTIKGEQIYAAVRIIDNGAMLNVNTAYEFNPAEADQNLIDGSSQLQINLMALAGRPTLPYWLIGEPYIPGEKTLLLSKRDMYGVSANLDDYRNFVIWSYDELARPYTPFDISDELELRYRFLLNHPDIDTRLEDWGGEFRNNTSLQTPISPSNHPDEQQREILDKENVGKWFKRAHFDPSILYMVDTKDPNYYAYRHIASTCNMDRIINPAGAGFNDGKMVNVNNTDAPGYLEKLLKSIWRGLYDAGFDDNALAAQIAVNIKDYVDSDSNVTSYYGYYGFESPCIYISEFVYKAVTTGDPETTYKSYAIELYNPYPEDEIHTTDSWRLIIYGDDDKTIDIDIDVSTWLQERKHFYVIRNQDDDNAPITIDEGDAFVKDSPDLIFTNNSKVELQREIDTDNDGLSDTYINVESWYVLVGLVPEEDGERTYERDVKRHKCIRRLWDSIEEIPTLGRENNFIHRESSDSDNLIQAHPANKPFTNIGEIGMIFCKSVYSQGVNPIGPSDTEATARVDLANPKFHQLFKYLTVFDPSEYGLENETRIKGRININTAPWFVIAQLPWVTHPNPFDPADPNFSSFESNKYNLAKAIVAYRDKGKVFNSEDPDDPTDLIVDYGDRIGMGFENIGELTNVVNGAEKFLETSRFSSMRYYIDGEDEKGFPDLMTDDSLTGGDGATDDFEERDLIFSRISNLVTVRSDVFTAYILVRIGTDGPQKRILAILDRSQVTSSGGKVRILALHPVPDPR